MNKPFPSNPTDRNAIVDWLAWHIAQIQPASWKPSKHPAMPGVEVFDAKTDDGWIYTVLHFPGKPGEYQEGWDGTATGVKIGTVVRLPWRLAKDAFNAAKKAQAQGP